MAKPIDLEQTVKDLNKEYFFNVINITGVSVVPRPPDVPRSIGFGGHVRYVGDRISGRLVCYEDEIYTFRKRMLRDILFEEMAHQLIKGDRDSADYKVIQRIRDGASDSDKLRFAEILRDNILEKSKNGHFVDQSMMPPTARAVIRQAKRAWIMKSLREDYPVWLLGAFMVLALFVLLSK